MTVHGDALLPQIIEFISVLVEVSGNFTLMELLHLGGLDRMVELFFE